MVEVKTIAGVRHVRAACATCGAPIWVPLNRKSPAPAAPPTNKNCFDCYDDRVAAIKIGVSPP